MHLDVPSEPPEDEEKYFSGHLNRGIRYYYYLENGLEIVDEFRNLILAIFALAILLKITNLWILGSVFFVSCILLTVIGYFVVHKIAKIKEWVNARFSTHFAIRNFDYQRDNNKLLREILDELKK